MGELEQDIGRLETLLRKLEKEYEMFFSGQQRREPSVTEGAMQSLIKSWSNRSIQNSGLAFRFNSIAARYNSFRAVWSRRLREKEEGRGPFCAPKPVKPKPAAPKPRGKPGAVPSRSSEFISRDSVRDAGDFARLFETYRELREKAGESTARLGRDSFQKALAEKVEKIKRDHGVDAVQIRIVEQQGKARIVAKPVRGKEAP